MTCSDSVIGFMKDYIEPLIQEVVPVGIGKLYYMLSEILY